MIQIYMERYKKDIQSTSHQQLSLALHTKRLISWEIPNDYQKVFEVIGSEESIGGIVNWSEFF